MDKTSMRNVIILLLFITTLSFGQTVPSYTVQAGPTTGSPGTAKFRLLVAGDIPQLPWTNITGATTGGTTGQVLTYDFNGASPYWANAVNTALNYNWTGDHTFNSPGAFEVVTGGGVSFEATSDISFASGGELSFDGTSDIKFFDNAHYNSGYSGAGESDSWLTSKAYVDAHSSSVTPAALTRVNDTNLIATLGGTPNTALLQAVSITLSWSGTLAAARLNSSVVQGVTNDTNVTGLISAQNLTLGWAGTLAAARLNANVVQAVTNETNITGSISAQTLTFAWSGTLAAARLNANVVQGVTNDTNITGSIATQNITLAWAGTLAYSRLVNGAGLSVVGRSANTSGVQADIAAGSDFNILRRSGSSIGFGSIDLSQSGAVGSSILPIANGGTGAATFTGYLLASGGTASASNTKTFNTANWNNVTGTFTATANNQFHTNETGTLTARATASDVLSYMVMDASLVYAAATQTLRGLVVANNFNNTSAQTTPTMVALEISPTVTGTNPTNMIMLRTPTTANWNVAIGNTTSSARLTVAGSGTTTGIAFLVANSSIATKFSVADNGNTSISATGASTGLNVATTWTATANNNTAGTSSGTLTARSTANDILSWTRNSVGITTGSTGQTLRLLYNTNTFTVSHTTATIIGNDYEPTIAGVQTASQHVAYVHRSGFIQWDSDISPAQITSNQNDYNPTGWYGASVIRLSTDAPRNITSFVGGLDGRLSVDANIGAFTITYKNDDGATGTAANRIVAPGDLPIDPNESVLKYYDATSSRWRIIGVHHLFDSDTKGLVPFSGGGTSTFLRADATWARPSYSNNFSGVGTATTVFTVTIGTTQANNTYEVNVTPTAALSAALFYVANKTTTTFDVTYLTGLTGTVTFDWVVTP